jgi:RNA polymerase sigma factor (sigma-70 family)
MIDVPAEPPDEPEPDFAQFYSATVRFVFTALCRRTGGVDLAWEVTQEAYTTMLELWPCRSSYCVTDNRKYTLAIARNRLIDMYRASTRHPVAGEVDPETMAEEEAGYGLVLDHQSTFLAIRRAIQQEKGRRRQVGDLIFLREWTIKQTAAALGIRESTVRSHIAELRKRLIPIVRRLRMGYQGGETHDE